MVQQAIGEKLDGTPLDDPNKGKNPAAVALGKLGGKKGGAARAAALSAAKRKAIARKAANARWKKNRPGETTAQMRSTIKVLIGNAVYRPTVVRFYLHRI